MGEVKDVVVNVARFLFAVCAIFLPWFLKYRLFAKILGYDIQPSAKIGLSFVYVKHLTMGKNAYIGHLNVCKSLRLLHVDDDAIIGNMNWISAIPDGSKHFSDECDRAPQLIIGRHSAITNRHFIDCCNTVEIGKYSIMGGVRSQVLTHAIDLLACHQKSSPVYIGDYCFVGTGVIILAGAGLPNYSVLGAAACLTSSFDDTHCLYAGVPAKAVKKLSSDTMYFHRNQGFVW